VNRLNKTAEAKIVANENALQALIDSGCNERPWIGTLPATDDFPEKETKNMNIIVEDDSLFTKTLKNLSALVETGRYITNSFYDMDLICIAGYEGKVSGKNELQFTQMSVSSTNVHGSDDGKTQFADVFGNGAKVHTLKKADKVETPVETEDPFA